MEKARLLRTASMTRAKTCSKLERKLTAGRSFREQISREASPDRMFGGAAAVAADDDLAGLGQAVTHVEDGGSDSDSNSDRLPFGRVSMAFEEVVDKCPHLVGLAGEASAGEDLTPEQASFLQYLSAFIEAKAEVACDLYTDDSTVAVYNPCHGTLYEFNGPNGIKALLTGLYMDVHKKSATDVKVVGSADSGTGRRRSVAFGGARRPMSIKLTRPPTSTGGGGAMLGYVLWECPSHGIALASETLEFDAFGRIMHHTIVLVMPSAPHEGPRPDPPANPLPWCVGPHFAALEMRDITSLKQGHAVSSRVVLVDTRLKASSFPACLYDGREEIGMFYR